jgi:hypothetical protein
MLTEFICGLQKQMITAKKNRVPFITGTLFFAI